MTPAIKSCRMDGAPEQAQDGIEKRLYRFEGCKGWVWRWFAPGDPTPYRSRAEAAEVLHHRNERRGQQS